MSSDGKKCLELVLLDGSNYESWCNSILHNIEAFNPYLLNIVDASICPPNINWSNLSEEEGKCLKLNAQAICPLTQSLSPNVEVIIIKEHGFPVDAHLLWIHIKDMFSDTIAAQDSRGAGYLIKSVRPVEKPVRLVWLSQLAQDFKKESVIDQIKIQFLRLALYLLQVMRSALWLNARKRRSQRRMRGKKKKMNVILIVTS
jgi:hypothetical protein